MGKPETKTEIHSVFLLDTPNTFQTFVVNLKKDTTVGDPVQGQGMVIYWDKTTITQLVPSLGYLEFTSIPHMKVSPAPVECDDKRDIFDDGDLIVTITNPGEVPGKLVYASPIYLTAP